MHTENVQELKELLLKTDEEFRQLATQHHELDDRIHELASKPYLSEPEQVEEVTLKKRKLHLKDRMEDILRRHRSEPAGGGFAQAVAISH
ncbi:MAG TPA: YdcH family protein [Vicinamibacterales bacterium]|nr:YdcH family protein [Vicinamibacterales bacterium]